MQHGVRLLVAVMFGISGAGVAGVCYAQAAAGAHANAQGNARVILGFKPGAAAAARNAVTAAGGRVVVDLAEVNGLAVEVPAGRLAALQRNPNVEYIEADPPRRVMSLPGTP